MDGCRKALTGGNAKKQPPNIFATKQFAEGELK